MNEKSTPIVISIFYNSANWHVLLELLIKPFLNQNHLIKSFHIYLSTFRGDHIKLVIISLSNKTNIEETLSDLVRGFLLSHPSQEINIIYPLPGFFLNYSNNSFIIEQKLFNSYPVEITEYGYDMRCEISKALAKVFGSEIIDIDEIFTFITYMQIAIIKSMYEDLNIAKIKIKSLINYLIDNNRMINHSVEGINITENLSYRDIFLYNQQDLSEIIKDVWDENEYDNSLKWIIDWEESCRSLISENDINNKFMQLTRLIYEHVGYQPEEDFKQSLQILSVLSNLS
ncbi:hypothetical protein [Pedobacter cryoconitis]|uniref:Thiopeptide-type bacteriocin biosynthesis domain-containing protein n=1 Tax=Pedobacter cryoconitis TaxID=188932 RepID=A0A7X0JAJ6_9SPHI|nr:hypothetical protein [Pedobacter cryoconitis]MBB6503022.1 hypothetical protein [Pedobacter cryoconitis]